MCCAAPRDSFLMLSCCDVLGMQHSAGQRSTASECGVAQQLSTQLIVRGTCATAHTSAPTIHPRLRYTCATARHAIQTHARTISAEPRIARPTRHVRPMMRPERLRMAEMRCSVRLMPARLSPPNSPTCRANVSGHWLFVCLLLTAAALCLGDAQVALLHQR